jgi:hypothetical protein
LNDILSQESLGQMSKYFSRGMNFYFLRYIRSLILGDFNINTFLDGDGLVDDYLDRIYSQGLTLLNSNNINGYTNFEHYTQGNRSCLIGYC